MFYGTPSKGRPKGSPNRVSNEVRRVISDLLLENANQLGERMSRLSDADFIKCFASLAKFVVPQQRAIIEDKGDLFPDKYTVEVIKGDGSKDITYTYEKENGEYKRREN